MKIKHFPYQLFLWVDQGFNVFTGGYADETFSARCYRKNLWVRPFVNTLFFWEKDHCRAAYEAEYKRKHLPMEYRR